jgi:nucleoside-diphosphate-sugar epimerase
MTCDNVSNNDTMIDELANLLPNFPGPANQTRCFLHVLNLIVKSILHQFDVPTSKKKFNADDDDESIDKGTKELLKLAGDIDREEEETVGANNEEDAIEDDNNEGWVDEHEAMTKEELTDLSKNVQPVRLLLTKVC